MQATHKIEGMFFMKGTKKEKLLTLYKTVNRLIAHLGAEGKIKIDSQLVGDVLDALDEIDDGVSDETKFKEFLRKV